MIINGFGGDGRIQGSSELIYSKNYTLTCTYDSTSYYKKFENGTSSSEYMNSNWSGTSPTFNTPDDIPTISSFYGLGYKAVYYDIDFASTVINGSWIFSTSRSNTITPTNAQKVHSGAWVRINSYTIWLLGDTVFTPGSANWWTGSGYKESGVVVNFNSATYTKYLDTSWGSGSKASLINSVPAGRQKEVSYTYKEFAPGQPPIVTYYNMSPTSRFSSDTAPSIAWGIGLGAYGNSEGASTYGDYCFGNLIPSKSVYRGTSTTAVTITATAPSVSIILRIYGIN